MRNGNWTGIPAAAQDPHRVPPTSRHRDIGGSPQAILLILYRRLSPWRAALTGRVVAWGRRPWLAFSLADRFYLP
jgi:hypothetical protein